MQIIGGKLSLIEWALKKELYMVREMLLASLSSSNHSCNSFPDIGNYGQKKTGITPRLD